MVRTVVPVRAHFPVRWPFYIYQASDLEPILLVCRLWRDVALESTLQNQLLGHIESIVYAVHFKIGRRERSLVVEGVLK